MVATVAPLVAAEKDVARVICVKSQGLGQSLEDISAAKCRGVATPVSDLFLVADAFARRFIGERVQWTGCNALRRDGGNGKYVVIYHLLCFSVLLGVNQVSPSKFVASFVLHTTLLVVLIYTDFISTYLDSSCIDKLFHLNCP